MSKFIFIIMRSIISFIILLNCFNITAQQQFFSNAVTITIKGTSNIHNWSAETNQVNIAMAAIIDSGILKSINELKATISVKSIKSSRGSIMDKNMYKALKAEAYPEIVYTLEKVYKIQSSDKQYSLSAVGNLSIAGVTHRIDLSISAFINTDKSMTIRFSKKIKMSNFNITPPVALFGFIRTGDEVELLFNCRVER